MSPGGRRRAIDKEDLLVFMQERDELFYPTVEFVDYFDASRPTVIKRLDALEEEDAIRRKDVGRSSAWYLPERENYRLVRFANNAGVEPGKFQQLLDKYGTDRLEKAVRILQEHDDELDDADIEALEVAASALAQGRDRQQVIKTLDVPHVEPGRERTVAAGGVALMVLTGFSLTYVFLAMSLFPAWPAQTTVLGVGLVAAVVGSFALSAAVVYWNLRRVGRRLDLGILTRPNQG